MFYLRVISLSTSLQKCTFFHVVWRDKFCTTLNYFKFQLVTCSTQESVKLCIVGSSRFVYTGWTHYSDDFCQKLGQLQLHTTTCCFSFEALITWCHRSCASFASALVAERHWGALVRTVTSRKQGCEFYPPARCPFLSWVCKTENETKTLLLFFKSCAWFHCRC